MMNAYRVADAGEPEILEHVVGTLTFKNGFKIRVLRGECKTVMHIDHPPEKKQAGFTRTVIELETSDAFMLLGMLTVAVFRKSS